MTQFEALLLGHLVGDFLLQNKWMAANKSTYLGPLLVHSTVYTLAVGAASFITGFIGLWPLILVWAGHLILDRRKIVQWWVRHLMGLDVDSQEQYWIVVVVDQVLHLLVLAMVMGL